MRDATLQTERVKRTTQPTYDKETGRLTQLTYDRNKNGVIDTWTDMDGARPVLSRIDQDEDGKIDRWEYYGADQKLAKVGSSRGNDGKEDTWSFAGPDGSIARIEVSTRRDGKVNRFEFYEKDVLPLLKQHCFRCHGGEPKVKGELNLTVPDTSAPKANQRAEIDSGEQLGNKRLTAKMPSEANRC